MKMHDVIDRLIARVPRDVEWSRGESYGAYNVQGNPDVTKVLYCVTPTVGVRAYMRQHGYQLLISHHPYVAGHGIPQFIAHTALDCAEGGLNDMWRDALDVRQARHFDGTLGWAGEIAPLPFDQLVERCRAFAGGVVGQQYRAAGTDETIGSVVICTTRTLPGPISIVSEFLPGVMASRAWLCSCRYQWCRWEVMDKGSMTTGDPFPVLRS